MKKLHLVLTSLFILQSTIGNAKDGPYVGADFLYANSNHQLDVASDDATVCGSICKTFFDGKETGRDSFGYSLNVGYKFNFKEFFVAPELFFDKLNNSSDGFHDSGFSDEYKAYKLDLNYRYGFKSHIGYNVTPKFNAFLTWGFANLDYDERPVKYVTSGVTRNPTASELDQLFGFGFAYSFNENISGKLTYDRQSMRLRSVNHGDEGSTIKTTLDVVKVGVAYSF